MAIVQKDAILSRCGQYRYLLRRTWRDDLPSVLFVGLNPSTADAVSDDPTVRRCVAFARCWGFGSLAIANLFAYRSTDPSVLQRVEDPIGPRNDWWLKRLTEKAKLTIAAWGIHGALLERAEAVLPNLRNVHHLGRTKEGHPRHPLYLPRWVSPNRFEARKKNRS